MTRSGIRVGRCEGCALTALPHPRSRRLAVAPLEGEGE